MSDAQPASELSAAWTDDPRWAGIERPYSAEEVVRLRGSVQIEHTLARRGARRLWDLLHDGPPVRSLGALTGNQAIQQVEAGLSSIYVSGWQVAADANRADRMYPDQSLYPVDSAPNLVRRINQALLRTDQIHHMNGSPPRDWLAPIVADAEAGFGGILNTYELMGAMIEAGAAGVHLEDQLSSLKKCGHMGGKVLVPLPDFIRRLVSARFAADVAGVPTILIARTDAMSAGLLRSDVDPVDREFIVGERTVEGYFRVRGGIEYAASRAVACAPYCDLVWCETSTPDLDDAREFAARVHENFPGKLLAYNCSPSFNWRRNLGEREIARFQETLGEMGYRYQFVTLAGFHSLNAGMYELARAYRDEGMTAYTRLQEREFRLEAESGYRAVRHQSFVGAGYYDEIQRAVSGGEASTTALGGSTEEAQFKEESA